MLEFSSLFNAHFHLFSQKNAINFDFLSEKLNFIKAGVSTAVNKADFLAQENYLMEHKLEEKIKLTFAFHPWYLNLEDSFFLEELAKKGRIIALGEAGFDFFTEELKESQKIQEEAWKIELELAKKFNLPIVIHCRKAFPLILKDFPALNQLPGVLFHGFSSSPEIMEEIVRKIPAAYFSFGRLILNNAKKSIMSLKKLPIEKILLESDEDDFTFLPHIYKRAMEVKEVTDFEVFSMHIENNFHNFYQF